MTIQLQYNTIRYDTIRYDTIRYDTIRYDILRYDTIPIAILNTMRCDAMSMRCRMRLRCDAMRYDTEWRYDTMRCDADAMRCDAMRCDANAMRCDAMRYDTIRIQYNTATYYCSNTPKCQYDWQFTGEEARSGHQISYIFMYISAVIYISHTSMQIWPSIYIYIMVPSFHFKSYRFPTWIHTTISKICFSKLR